MLVVDDYEDSAEIACDPFEALGFETHACYRGRDALVDRLAPDIAILDISLADMSGYEVARVLRARANGNSLHLIALTGFGGPEHRGRALEAGFDQHVVKPLDLATLKSMIAQAVMPRKAGSSR